MARSKYEDKGISRRDVLKAGGALITSTALCGLLPKTSAAKEARTPTNFKFKNLFKPGRIGKFTIKNRIIKSSAGPGSMASQNDDGSPTQQALDYYGNIARGGVGLLCISMGGSAQLVDEIHKYNIPAIAAAMVDMQ